MMNTKTIKKYITELSKARVEITDDPYHPVTFNRADNFADYQLYLLGLEIELLPLAVKIVLNRTHTNHWRKLAYNYCLHVESLFTGKNINGIHRHLLITKRNELVSLQDLSNDHRKYLDRFLTLQRESFERTKASLLVTTSFRPSDFMLEGTEIDLNELINFLWHSGAVKGITPGVTKKAFAGYFSAMMNRKCANNFEDRIHQSLGRYNPLKYVDKLREQYLDYAEQREQRKK